MLPSKCVTFKKNIVNTVEIHLWPHNTKKHSIYTQDFTASTADTQVLLTPWATDNQDQVAQYK